MTVFPSSTETFGNVVLESLACKTPHQGYFKQKNSLQLDEGSFSALIGSKTLPQNLAKAKKLGGGHAHKSPIGIIISGDEENPH